MALGPPPTSRTRPRASGEVGQTSPRSNGCRKSWGHASLVNQLANTPPVQGMEMPWGEAGLAPPHQQDLRPISGVTPVTCPADAGAAVHHDWGAPGVTLEARSQGADRHPLLLLHSPQKVDESGRGGGDTIIRPAQVLEVGHQPPLPGLGESRGVRPSPPPLPLATEDPQCPCAVPHQAAAATHLRAVDLQDGFLVMVEVLHAQVGDGQGPEAHLEILLQGPVLAALSPASLLQPGSRRTSW